MTECGNDVTHITYRAARADTLGIALLCAGCRIDRTPDHVMAERGKLYAFSNLTADCANHIGKSRFGAGRRKVVFALRGLNPVMTRRRDHRLLFKNHLTHRTVRAFRQAACLTAGCYRRVNYDSVPGGGDIFRVGVSAKRAGVGCRACLRAGRCLAYSALIVVRALRHQHVAVLRLCLYLTAIACLCRSFAPVAPVPPTGIGKQLVVCFIVLLCYRRAVIPIRILTNISVGVLISFR